MTKLMKETIRDAVFAYLDAGNSANQLSQASTVNAAYISHIRNGKWEEDDKLVPEKVWKLLEVHLKVSDMPIETDAFQKVVGLLMTAKETRQAGLIDAPTGTGKTYAAEWFRKRFPKATYIVRCAQDMTTKELLRNIHEVVLDKRHTGKTLAEMRQDVQLILNQRYNDKPILIIDEAENLRDSAYGVVKAMFDGMVNHCGIVLIGANDYTEYLQRKALRVSKNRSRVDCFPQIWRRFKTLNVVLSSLTDSEVVEICKTAGVTDRELIKQVIHKAQYHSDVFAAIQSIKTEEGE